jgi:deoxyribodipyrimidine photolyase-related protein
LFQKEKIIMSHEITLIFPHQLFQAHPCLTKSKVVWLVEDFLFFRQYPFHSHKLILHRASMKNYERLLLDQSYTVQYVESSKLTKRESLGKLLSQAGVTQVSLVDVTDTWLEEDLIKASKVYHFELEILDTPLFLTTREEFDSFFANKKKPFMKTFYEWQRKRLGILMDGDAPLGGRYSFDTENRKKLPKDYVPSALPEFVVNPFVAEAKHYVETHFPKAYGTGETFCHVTTHEEARAALSEFLQSRFYDFGPYEDALSTKYTTINHSLLSSPLNIGLLTPKEVIDAALLYHEKLPVPLPSLEGFVRQIVGWREFVRALYIRSGTSMRRGNFFEHHKKLGPEWWDATTGLLPVDTVISRMLHSAYSHHIERLMIIGNAMLLSEIEPDEVYRWFMELSIDGYDWVMVPNVYGMSQFADGGSFTTKPYFSGSNYIRKMSDYPQGEWCTIWDNQFWAFLEKHQTFFAKNPRLSMLVGQIEKRKKR